VFIVRLPSEADGSKNGVDDFIVRHGADALDDLVDTAINSSSDAVRALRARVRELEQQLSAQAAVLRNAELSATQKVVAWSSHCTTWVAMARQIQQSRWAHLVFQLRPGAYNDETLIEFLSELHQLEQQRPVVLIWDVLPAHHSGRMLAWLASQCDWFQYPWSNSASSAAWSYALPSRLTIPRAGSHLER
jgi:hypothetical protein